MISAVFTYGGILAAILLIITIIAIKATPQTSYAGYFPGFIVFAVGLILLLFATIIDRVWIMDAGLGGWGIACLFAAAISLVIGAIFDVFRQEHIAS